MTEATLDVQAHAADAIDTLMVPALLREWAPRVAEAARIRPGERVLDVACGTGTLAREVAARTGPSGMVSGLDPSQAMLAAARRRAPHLVWKQGVAEALPFANGVFDAVVSQFGLTFFTDRRAALGEALRVLAPGGRLAVAVWDALERHPAYAAEVAVVERLAGPAAAEPLRTPFVLGDRDGLAALVGESGFASVEVRTARGTARFPNVRAMVEADLRGRLFPAMDVVLPEDQVARIVGEAETALAPFVVEDGSVAFETSAHIVTAVKA